MKASLPLFAFVLIAAASHADTAFDVNTAKNTLRALQQEFTSATDPAQRERIARSIIERTAPLTKAEPDGLGGWLMHGEAALELKDRAACKLANTQLARIQAEKSGNPLAPSVMKGLQALLAQPVDPVAAATKEHPFVNSLGMKFVPVPGVKVRMCIHETRKKDYLPFFQASGSKDDEWLIKKNGKNLMIPGDDYPVGDITWDEANGFCEWLSKRENKKYRLCTDHEWSCAAGLADEDSTQDPMELSGKHPGVFPWGSGFPPKNATANVADDTFAAIDPKLKSVPGYHDGFGLMAPVMSFPPNDLGIHDLAGNVSEWTLSLARAGKTDLSVRGSGWAFFSETGIRSDYRSSKAPNSRGFTTGFRIVVEPAPPPVIAIVSPPTPPNTLPQVGGNPPPKPAPTPARAAAPVPVRERLKPQPNGDLMLVDLPTVGDAEGMNDIDMYSLVWMKKYFGWKADVQRIVQRHKLDLSGDYDAYKFITGTFAKDAHVRVKNARTFDKNDGIRALKKGSPILVWRAYRDAREGVLVGYAQQRKSNPEVKLPDPSDPEEKKNWPKYDKALDEKGERVMMASIIYGYNEKQNEFIMLDPLFGDAYQLIWITSEELKATVTDVFFFD